MNKTKDRLIYLPLGGAGEIGMNAYVYGYGPKDKERLIVVDLGVTFPDMDSSPGVDLIMADIAWLEARRDRIEPLAEIVEHQVRHVVVLLRVQRCLVGRVDDRTGAISLVECETTRILLAHRLVGRQDGIVRQTLEI